MVTSSAGSAIALSGQPPAVDLADMPAATASIVNYLESGERTRELTALAFKLCVAVVVLLALAWTVGILPAAVKLF